MLADLIQKNKYLVLLLFIFLIFVFFRVYQFEERAVFSWDQVDNAWNAKNMIINHNFPLVGMQARQGSGFFIGPFYYYFVSFFYFLTNLDPIASPIISLIISIFSFLTLFYVTKKIFNLSVSIIACFIYSFSFSLIIFDRVQWPVAFVPSLTLLAIYFIYEIINKKEKYIFFLMILMGFLFHIHFSAVSVSLMVVLSIPFFPRTKKTIRYFFLSLPFLLICFLPQALFYHQTNPALLFSSAQNSNHGFHLKRFFQISSDALLYVQSIVSVKAIPAIKYLLLPIFIILSIGNLVILKKIKIKNGIFALIKKITRDKDFIKLFVVIYLFALSYLIPWIIYSLYRGEISNYFFCLGIFPSVIMISYIISIIYNIKELNSKIIVFIILGLYVFINSQQFFSYKIQGLTYYKEKVKLEVINNKKIQFIYGAPESYLEYFYKREWRIQNK